MVVTNNNNVKGEMVGKSKEKADLIIHPVRLRILQILADHSLTTGEISDRMPDVAKSSIYRHLRKLLDGGMVAVSEVKTVKGTAEKVFSCVVPPTISVQDIESMSKEDHLYYFSAYAATLIQGFKRYLEFTRLSGLNSRPCWLSRSDFLCQQ